MRKVYEEKGKESRRKWGEIEGFSQNRYCYWVFADWADYLSTVWAQQFFQWSAHSESPCKKSIRSELHVNYRIESLKPPQLFIGGLNL